MSQPHISELREHLMATLAGLRDRENPMEPDRARAVAQVAGVLVDTARVEVDYIKATGQDNSGFLQALPSASTTKVTEGLPNGITSITQHRLTG